jgi:DNA-binding transcriptional LysR family regulator
VLDLARLRLLRDLARLGTMTAVAEALGQTSSAVSQQLAILEREARAPLLERSGRRVRLTTEGQALAAHAETILQAVEAAELDLRAARDAPDGVLEVATFPSFAKTRLLPAILRLRDRWPGLTVTIREEEPIDSLETLREGRRDLVIDFAYSLTPRGDAANLTTFPILEEPVLLALPAAGAPTGSVALETFAQANWIVGSRQSDDHRLAERACALAGFAPRIVHTIDDYDLMLRMVAAGLGVGFAPEMVFGLAGVVARPVADLVLTRRIQAVTRPTLAGSARVRAVVEALIATPGA